jgi:SAM-dependent methyltransferase
MRIPWKIKSAIFSIIDRFHLYRTLYFLQKHITKRSGIDIPSPSESWVYHLKHLKALSNPTLLEFGAGHNLAQNIYLSQAAQKQIVVDFYRMFDAGLCDRAANQISKFADIEYCEILSEQDLSKYAIEYRAPLNIAFSGFEDDVFDICVSTNTLEHIPREQIISIFQELKRIIKPSGLLSSVIDYSDHYSHTDKRISPANFLKYSEAEYTKYNHQCHYQNRLRHYDYEQLFSALGFEIAESQALGFANPPQEPIDKGFQQNNPSLFAKVGHFQLVNIK